MNRCGRGLIGFFLSKQRVPGDFLLEHLLRGTCTLRGFSMALHGKGS